MIKPGTRTFEFGPDDSIGVNTEGQLVVSLNDGSEMPAAGTVLAPASWDLALCRYFLLDPVNGSDRNVGFVDAVAGSTISPAGKAKATIAGIMSILPMNGNGRKAVVLHAPSTITESIDLSPLKGYAFLMWRGSTDLTNDASDKITCGGVVAVAGPGSNGEFTCTTGGTFTSIPIAVGSFGADPAAVTYRIRFLPTTTTVALRNICRPIYSHTTTVITLGSALANNPIAGDVFVIERPGAVLVGAKVDGNVCMPTSVSGVDVNIVGLRFTGIAAGSVSFSGGCIRGAFLELTGVTTNSVLYIFCAASVRIIDTYSNEIVGSVALGMGLRTSTGYSIDAIFNLELVAFGSTNTALSPFIQKVLYGRLFARSFLAKWPVLYGCGLGARDNTTISSGASVLIVGETPLSPNQQGARVTSGMGTAQTYGNCSLSFTRIDFQGFGASPIFVFSRVAGCTISIDGCTGSTGNTGVGLDLSASVSGCTFILGKGQANTFTGSAGDILLPGGVITTHVSLTQNNITDQNGNRLIGTAPVVIDQAVRFVNAAGTALVVGEVVRVAATDTVVRAQADTAAKASGALYVAITPPANGAAGYFVAMNASQKWILHSAAPTLLGLSYLSNATAGQATTTVPPTSATEQKRRLGHVAKVSGNLGLVTGSPDLLSVAADSLA